MKKSLIALTAAAAVFSATQSQAQAVDADACLANLLKIDEMVAKVANFPGDVQITLNSSLRSKINDAVRFCEQSTNTTSSAKSMDTPSLSNGNLTLVLPIATIR